MDIKQKLRNFIVATQDEDADLEATNKQLANIIDVKVKERYDAEMDNLKSETKN